MTRGLPKRLAASSVVKATSKAGLRPPAGPMESGRKRKGIMSVWPLPATNVSAASANAMRASSTLKLTLLVNDPSELAYAIDTTAVPGCAAVGDTATHLQLPTKPASRAARFWLAANVSLAVRSGRSIGGPCCGTSSMRAPTRLSGPPRYSVSPQSFQSTMRKVEGCRCCCCGSPFFPRPRAASPTPPTPAIPSTTTSGITHPLSSRCSPGVSLASVVTVTSPGSETSAEPLAHTVNNLVWLEVVVGRASWFRPHLNSIVSVHSGTSNV